MPVDLPEACDEGGRGGDAPPGAGGEGVVAGLVGDQGPGLARRGSGGRRVMMAGENDVPVVNEVADGADGRQGMTSEHNPAQACSAESGEGFLPGQLSAAPGSRGLHPCSLAPSPRPGNLARVPGV